MSLHTLTKLVKFSNVTLYLYRLPLRIRRFREAYQGPVTYTSKAKACTAAEAA